MGNVYDLKRIPFFYIISTLMVVVLLKPLLFI
jgi:hypothetical protein